jgi:dihydropteroate synthase
MGIINITPDSFFDGGRYTNSILMVKQAKILAAQGASIIDIGGMSSRPGAAMISVTEELARVLPAIKAIRQSCPNTLLSIDTFRSEVAREAVAAGVDIINDISAGNLDDDMFTTVASLGVPYIMMHMQGVPRTMQVAPNYANIVHDIEQFFVPKIAALQNLGVHDIILDVGFGFGKTLEQNYTLLQNLAHFNVFNRPLLVGVSRKSMLYKLLNISPQEALNATSVAHTVALLHGANILRVHDVMEAKQAVSIVGMLKKTRIV